MKKTLGLLLLLLSVALQPAFALASQTPSDPPTAMQQAIALNAQIKAAMLQVMSIVNKPVTHMQRSHAIDVAVYSPGWFHPGAKEPNYNTVDIRATRELPYEKNEYVTSDLNPNEMFFGSELEFNPMTKYFYTDRTVPKKKLTEAEMLKINALYRVIGRCEQQLADLKASQSSLLPHSVGSVLDSPYTTAALVVLLAAGLLVYRKRYS
jgi:hypothetical protein